MRVLTGITTSGTPHLGNYIGAIRPGLEAQSQSKEVESLFFLADYHSLVKLQDPKQRQCFIREMAAAWLASGLDTKLTIFYRQSDIPEIPELQWILACVTAKGLLNRAHAYKDIQAKNEKTNLDADAGINMGLFCYPILMAADILAFNANFVPVGKDQIQHIEIARDIATHFNRTYGNFFVLPEVKIQKNAAILPGHDGRKMSKSYGNTIPLFLESAALRKSIMKIVTNSQAPHEPKDPEKCSVFQIYQAFASPAQTNDFAKAYAAGISWGEAKLALFELLDLYFSPKRELYQHLLHHPEIIEKTLTEGAEKARAISGPALKSIRQLIGILS